MGQFEPSKRGAVSQLRVAFISYEYAGLAKGGGIGTYVRNAAAMLAGRGHDVEVFTEGKPGVTDAESVRVHTVATPDREAFAMAVEPVFSARHREAPFDVVEAAEYGADASVIVKAYPDLPLVVKLHTPAFLISEINHQFVPWSRKARFLLGGLRHGRWPRPYWRYDAGRDAERAFTLRADEVTSPSKSLLEMLQERWSLDPERCMHVPNVFVPPPSLLDILPETATHRVTFVGKLEVRKGVLELAEAIPHVLAAYPAARFRFLGRSLPHPNTGEDLKAHMLRRLGAHAAAVEFIDAVPYDAIPSYYADTDVCAFPSVWENFPNVCLEAMSAARGIVASSSGGMAEMVEDGATGRVVVPGEARTLAQAIVELLTDPEGRMRMGVAARYRAVHAYEPEAVSPVQEASYRRAIARKAASPPVNYR